MSRYESHNLEAQDLPFIYNERSIHPSYRTFGSFNWHENIEILYITGGQGAISNNGHVLSVTKGDITVINANHLHALSSSGEALIHRYLIVDRTFCLANGFDTNAISFNMRIDDTAIRQLMEELHETYQKPADAPYRTPEIRSIVLRIMTLLCRDHSTSEKQAERPERSISYVKQAIDYIRASFDKDFSLEDVAAFVGVNKCYLSREFHKYTGYPFVSYVNHTRCKMAQHLLLDPRLSIHEVGLRCGFENRSYFARSFRRYIGMLPGEYRANALGASTGVS